LNTPIIRRTLADGSEITAKTHLPGVDIVTIRAQAEGEVRKEKFITSELYLCGKSTTKDNLKEPWRIEKRSESLKESWILDIPNAYNFGAAYSIMSYQDRIFIAGTTKVMPSYKMSTLLRRLSPSGDIEKEFLLSPATTQDCYPSGLVVDESGVYIIERIAYQWEGSTVKKYDYDFNLQWSTIIPNSYGRDVIFGYTYEYLSYDLGYVYICFPMCDVDDNSYWSILKIDKADGSIKWIATDPTTFMCPASIKVDDTGIYTGGTISYDGKAPSKWYIEKREKENGNIVWSQTVEDSIINRRDLVYSVSLDLSSVYILGWMGFNPIIQTNPIMRLEKRSKVVGSLEAEYIYDGMYGHFTCITNEYVNNLYVSSRDKDILGFAAPTYKIFDKNLEGIINSADDELNDYGQVQIYNISLESLITEVT
jgi:hypothetical protein